VNTANEVCKLTVVVDNQAAEGLTAEHGYALHIATPRGNLLLDTGQKTLMKNLATLRVDPGKIDKLVLSHGHYDHSGGIADLLEVNSGMELYLHSAAFEPRYVRDGEETESVRMPLPDMNAVMRHKDEKTHWLTKPMELLPGLGVTGPIPRKNGFEDTGGEFYLDPEGTDVDTIKDDIALWLKTPEGLVVCIGCCHSGLINTLDHIVAATGERRIRTIIGGMHLLHATRERLEKTVAELQRFAIGNIIACHCSGEKAVEFLASELEAEVVAGYAGLSFDVEELGQQ